MGKCQGGEKKAGWSLEAARSEDGMKSFIQLHLKYCGLCAEDYIEVFVSEEEVPRSNLYIAHSTEVTSCGTVISYRRTILQVNSEASPKLAASRGRA